MYLYKHLHLKHLLFFSDSNRTLIFAAGFRKILQIKFHESPSIGSRVVPCGQTDMTKLIVAFLNFANTPKSYHSVIPCKMTSAVEIL